MWGILTAVLLITQTDASQWRAGWEKAKTRTALKERLRERLRSGVPQGIAYDEYIRERLKYLTPQEEKKVMAVLTDYGRREVERQEALRQEFAKGHERMQRILEWLDGKKPPPAPK